MYSGRSQENTHRRGAFRSRRNQMAPVVESRMGIGPEYSRQEPLSEIETNNDLLML
jgi:hypothetical protein